MTDELAPSSVPAGQAFDAALTRGRTALADPLPVLPKVDPRKASTRMATELRGMLSDRFAHSLPAAMAAEMHRKSVKALGRLEWQFFLQRVRVAVAGFLATYGLAILGFLVVAVLVGLAMLYREAMLAFVSGLLASFPVPHAPGHAPANALASTQLPAGGPPLAGSGAPAPSGTAL